MSDIEKKRLYVLKNKDVYVRAFVLVETLLEQSGITWLEDSNQVYYVVRFGVHPKYQSSGIGDASSKK